MQEKISRDGSEISISYCPVNILDVYTIKIASLSHVYKNKYQVIEKPKEFNLKVMF